MTGSLRFPSTPFFPPRTTISRHPLKHTWKLLSMKKCIPRDFLYGGSIFDREKSSIAKSLRSFFRSTIKTWIFAILCNWLNVIVSKSPPVIARTGYRIAFKLILINTIGTNALVLSMPRVSPRFHERFNPALPSIIRDTLCIGRIYSTWRTIFYAGKIMHKQVWTVSIKCECKTRNIAIWWYFVHREW